MSLFPQDFVKKFVTPQLALLDSSQLYVLPRSASLYKSSTYLYDVCPVDQRLFAIAQRNLPVKIIDSQGTSRFNIQIKKKHSQEFLVPLEMRAKLPLLFAAGKKFVFNYDLNKLKKIKDFQAQKRMASCLHLSQNLMAVGFYDSNHISVFDLRTQKLQCRINGHVDGVTQVQCLQESLVSRARNDNLIYHWDLRNPGNYLQYFQVFNSTNQRLYFNLENGKDIYIGDQFGNVHLVSIGEPRKSSFALADMPIPCLTRTREQEWLVSVGCRGFEFDEKQVQAGRVIAWKGADRT